MRLTDLPKRQGVTARGCMSGYVYVIQFASGVIKVGQTTCPRSRMKQHQADARKFGGDLARWWVSHEHEQWLDNERSLIEACEERGSRTVGEYFTGCDYDEIVAVAEKLDVRPYSASFVIRAGVTDWSEFDDWSRAHGVLRRVSWH